jgi:5-methylcytosine-specific restriction enzyme A
MARTKGHGNPKWTWDETLLALDLYVDCGRSIPSSEDPRVKELSRLLRTLPHHAIASRQPTFRNPDGVVFKLQNLRQLATGKGLGNVSATDRKIWAEYGSKLQSVKQVASRIRQAIELSDALSSEQDNDDDQVEFAEGGVFTAIHRRRERNRNIRKRLIAARKKKGQLQCEMCQSLPWARNVTLEAASFEAHHVVPVAAALERKTRLSDMALLCANCHRLLHRAISLEGRWLDIYEARQYLAEG